MIGLERVLHTEQNPSPKIPNICPLLAFSPHRPAGNCNSHHCEEQSDASGIPECWLMTAAFSFSDASHPFESATSEHHTGLYRVRRKIAASARVRA
jgi:hypothetical protein